VLLHRFGRIVSKEQLVEQLYRFNEAVTHNVIEVYVHRVRKKIAGAGLVVRTVYGRGYVLELACETESVQS
jgi:DNA-binding response OmpR family regulator